MACCNPMHILVGNENIPVPCGYCLNCRVDKRNFLEDCCRASYASYPSSCFGVLTYDDIHLADYYRITSDGTLVASLQKKDAVDFMKRFRSYLNYNIDTLKKSDLVKIKKTSDGTEVVDFKYVLVGEYGEHHRSGLVDRPHYHFLMFGIDPILFNQAIHACWTYGDIYLGDIKAGGIRYVLKYLDKQIKGSDAVSKYDINGLERPFQSHSLKLGYDYFYDNIDEISKNNWTYLSKNNQRRPISSYLKKLFRADVDLDNSFIIQNLKDIRVKPEYGKTYSLKQQNELRAYNALLRNHHLCEQSRNDGYPAIDYSILKSKGRYPVHELARQAIIGSLDDIPF